MIKLCCTLKSSLNVHILFTASSIVLGILKSTHKYIQLSRDNVITNDDTADVKSYEFGSGIIGVNLVDKNGQPVSINQKIINITFDFVLKVS